MRLTLRTLLAFRDDVLDAKDAANLEARIRESGTAKAISQRVTDVLKNRRLAPISLDEREFGFEANNVANFLDDSIDQEHLPDMERKCLENNSLLAEVASCHQVLSRVVSVPLSIPQGLRERLYELNARSGSKAPSRESTNAEVVVRRMDKSETNLRGPHVPLTSTDSAGNTSNFEQSPRPHASAAIVKPRLVSATNLGGSGIELSDSLGKQVPEYLQGNSRSHLLRLAQIVALLLLFGVSLFMAIGPIDRISGLLREDSGRSTEVAKLSTNRGSREPAKSIAEDVKLGAEATESKLNAATEPDKTSSEDTDSDIVESASAPPMANVTTDASALSEALNSGSSSKSGKGVVPPSVIASKSQPTLIWNPESKSSADCLVLSRRDDRWKVLSPGQSLEVGSRLIVPPAFRTELMIPPGIRWTVAGETDISFVGSTSASAASIRVDIAKAILTSTPDVGQIVFSIGDENLLIQFAKPGTSCAIDVHRYLPLSDSGIDARPNLTASLSIDLYGLNDEVSFKIVSDKVTAGNAVAAEMLGKNVKVHLSPSHKPVRSTYDEPLWWFKTSIERPVDQLAAADLFRLVQGSLNVALDEELTDLTSYRRPETAALAYRTRILMGEYHGLFGEDGCFSKVALKSHWQKIIDQIPVSFTTAAREKDFKDALKADSPTRADEILKLLLPKNQAQLDAGAAKMYVDNLSNSSLTERILALHQLVRITGKNLGYTPDQPTAEAIQHWKVLLNSGEIRFPDETKETYSNAN